VAGPEAAALCVAGRSHSGARSATNPDTCADACTDTRTDVRAAVQGHRGGHGYGGAHTLHVDAGTNRIALLARLARLACLALDLTVEATDTRADVRGDALAHALAGTNRESVGATGARADALAGARADPRASLRTCRLIQVHAAAVSAVELISPSQLWRLDEAGDDERRLVRFDGHSGAVAALQGDGDKVVSAARDGTVRVWDVEAGKERFRLQGFTRYVGSLHLTPSRLIADGTNNAVVCLDFAPLDGAEPE